mgnify:CR=1 FL=1
MANARKILIVDDDTDLRDTLMEQLSLHDEFEAQAVDTGAKGASAAKANSPDLVLMDVGLPDTDGREVVRSLRKGGFKAPIIMLTGHDTDSDTILGLESGANDYVAKPFEPIELVARARAVLRRLFLDRGAMVSIGNLSYDVVNRVVCVDQAPIVVPRRELAILEALVRRSGRVVLRETLESAAYGFEDEIQSNAIEAHVSRLRRRLREANCKAAIRPVRGLGYLLSGE